MTMNIAVVKETGDPEGAIRPDGTGSDWTGGNKEDIVIGD